MLWVRVAIWVALAALGIGVVTVVFRGGTIPQPTEFAADPTPGAVPSARAGEMAYDRFAPGGRSDPDRLRSGAP